MILFVLMPVSASGLCFRLHVKEVTEPSCYLYYATTESPIFSEEQKVSGIYDVEHKTITFSLNGSLAGKLTGLRMDFANVEQLVGFDGISVSSAGVVKHQYEPAEFFVTERLAEVNDIPAINSIPAGNMVYMLMGAEDPYLVLGDQVTAEFNGYFSHYRLSRILVCLFVVLFMLSCEFKPFAGRTLKECVTGIKNTEEKTADYSFYLAAFLGMVLVYFIYRIVLVQSEPVLSDYHGHLWVYLPLFYTQNWWSGWMAVPYCMWHVVTMFFHSVLMVPWVSAGAFSSCVFALLTYFITYWILQRVIVALTCRENSAKAALLAFGLSILQGLYTYWTDTFDGYLGIYSANPLHNPTQMCVKPFVLLALCLVYDIWGKIENSSYKGMFFKVEKGHNRYYFLLSLFMFLSSLAKPTFAQMFIPAVGVLMLINWIGQLIKRQSTAKSYFMECLKMLLCAIPSLAYILISYVEFFLFGGSVVESGAPYITSIGEVWMMYSQNIYLSIFLGMAFPLLIMILDGSFFVKDQLGRLAVVCYFVGLVQALLLGEGGEKLSHGNFIWPMLSAMLILWTVSVIRLLCLESSKITVTWKKLVLKVAWVLFFAHVLCGYFYIQQLL